HADTNVQKCDCFRRGLNTKLKECLNPIKVDTYNELVNLAITQEDCIMAHRAEKKRKAPARPSSVLSQRYRLVQPAAPRVPQNAPQHGQWIFMPPNQQGVSHYPVPQHLGPR